MSRQAPGGEQRETGETLGDRIRALRRAYGLSQTALADLLGVSNVTVNRWEHGNAAPRAALLARIAELEARGPEAPEDAPAGAPVGNLPSAPGPIIGRDAELTALTSLIAGNRLVTIVGPGGVGKTRLTLAAGRALAGDMPDGVWLADLSAITGADAIPHLLARVLDVRDHGATPLEERIAGEIGRRKLLLVLDSCEHVLAGVNRVAVRLVAAGGASRIVATSRMPLGIAGEREFSLGSLAPEAAARLFVVRAREQAVEPGAAESEAIGELCRRLDQLPLAIELAAARSRLLTAEQMLERLDRRFELLRRDGGDTDRHRTLETTIAWSCDLLEAGEAQLFRALGIFAGRFDIVAVEAIAGNGETLERLDRLVRRSMVVAERETESAPVRYRLLDSLAAYARRWLAEAGELDEIAARHARYYATAASEAAGRLRSREHLAALATLDRKHDNIAVALDWLIRSGDVRAAHDLASALARYWLRSSRMAEGCAWLRRALELAPEPTPERVRALNALALLAFPIGELDDAERAAQTALAEARAIGDRSGEAGALERLGYMRYRRGDLRGSEEHFEAAFPIREALGEPRALATIWQLLGDVAGLMGDFTRSRTCYQEAWVLTRAAGDVQTEGVILHNLGELSAHTHEYARGIDYNRRAAAIFKQLGDQAVFATALANTAELEVMLGDYQAAVEHAGEAMALIRAAGNQAHLANLLYVHGVALAAAGDAPGALAALREATVIDFARDDFIDTSYHIEAIARLHADAGDAELAVRLLAGSGAIRQRLDAPDYEPFDREGAIARARRRLDPALFAAVWCDGEALSPAALVDEAHAGTVEAGVSSVLLKQRAASERVAPNLTVRQLDVLRLVAAGQSNRQIAEELGISARTVERHLAMIYTDLGANRRSAAVAEAIALGLL